tara:strand:- start:11176 stop:11556 length:381 start_codon:yes stop_codon:yes gene_type:complete
MVNQVQTLAPDDTFKYVQQMLREGMIDPGATMTDVGGTSELDSEGAFTHLKDCRDSSLLRIRHIDKAHYLVKVVPFGDPSGVAQGTKIYTELSSLAQGGSVEIATPIAPKSKRRRRRPRRRKGTTV